ncbi:MAG TPA: aspartyl protease family protein [Candidatus Saccharimonadales bacterium]|nr:aspartyl protease family protein [Candidatus Saccharimonadales bacterium]
MRALKRCSVLLLAAALGAASLPAPGPAAGLALKDVLARHARALGGLAHLRALKGLCGVGTISVGGLSGTVHSWMLYPSRVRDEIQIAVLRQVVVQDSASAWMLDQSGQVKDLTGLELQDQLSQQYVESFGYLLAPGSGTVGFSKDSPESTQYINLQACAKGGLPVQLCLDPKTYLVRKRVQQSPAGKVEEYLSDYRAVAGVKMAFRTVQMIAGDAVRSVTLVTDTVQVVSSLPDSLWRKPGVSTRDWSFPEGVRSVSIPVEIYNHHVYLKARVNGSGALSFLLDSGAGSTAIEKGSAEALGLKSEGKLGAQGVGGSTDFGLTVLDSLEVGGVVLRQAHAVTIALPEVVRQLGRPLDGILGYDFLSRFVVSIDYAQKALTVSLPDAWKAPPGAVALPVELVQNVPVVRAACDGKYSGRFIVDTGNNGALLLHGPFVREHGLLERAARKVAVLSHGAGGEENGYAVHMDSLVLGGLAVRRPLVTLSTSERGITGANTQLAGNIGGWILEQFVLTFDYPDHKLYLEPGGLYGEEMSLGRIGWQVARREGRLTVVFVPPDTPAQQAGVLAGDVLLKLEGQDITNLDVPELRQATNKDAGTKLHFELRRGEETRNVEITLADLP